MVCHARIPKKLNTLMFNCAYARTYRVVVVVVPLASI
jgi:hypothetical protein